MDKKEELDAWRFSLDQRLRGLLNCPINDQALNEARAIAYQALNEALKTGLLEEPLPVAQVFVEDGVILVTIPSTETMKIFNWRLR